MAISTLSNVGQASRLSTKKRALVYYVRNNGARCIVPHYYLPTSYKSANHSPKKIITLREELGEFEEPKDLLKLHELIPLEWQEWAEEGITIRVN